MDRVNLACSEADEIRSLMGHDPSMFDIAPVRSRNRIDIYLLPFFLISWWVRFGTLRAQDEDLIRLRNDMKMYSWYGALALAVLVGITVYSIAHR